MSYHHFTIDERESILIYRTQGLNFSQIAKLLHRHPSSISREWKRHTKSGASYCSNRSGRSGANNSKSNPFFRSLNCQIKCILSP